jgi:hypothetical protein
METFIICASNISLLITILLLPLVYGIRKGKFQDTLLATWYLMIIWYWTTAFIAPLSLYQFDPSLAEFFPNTRCLLAAALVGPIWGALIYLIAEVVRNILAKFWPVIFDRLCVPQMEGEGTPTAGVHFMSVPSWSQLARTLYTSVLILNLVLAFGWLATSERGPMVDSTLDFHLRAALNVRVSLRVLYLAAFQCLGILWFTSPKARCQHRLWTFMVFLLFFYTSIHV